MCGDAMYSRRDFARLTLSGVALSAFPVVRLFGAGGAAAPIESTVRGVKLGVITGGFAAVGGRGIPAPGNGLPVPGERDPADAIIENLLTIGAANIELSANLYGAPTVIGGAVGGQAPATTTPEYLQSREALRQWRLTAPLDRFREVRAKFKDAGLNLFSYVVTIGDDFTDPEIDAVFRQMQALGVSIFCTNQTRVAMGPRIKPFAEQYQIHPAFHTH